ncbi:methyltransferase domain-containing protein [Metabacillus fastidiosus]|uniref:class I SAM-dependent methyltransferase n=1 Tax=Metabacillus fastidiosus TaxID=1458 RepID=UPI002E1E92A5|nr:methyltransferase domain-containing protein [Metabacillus fastidiosus]
MLKMKTFQEYLNEFLEKFKDFSAKYDHTINHCSELEILIDDYSKFILNEKNKEVWEQLELQECRNFNQLVGDLRKKAALCVAIMEKYRALKLLSGNTESNNYFENIELCIEKEFGQFQITSESKVLLVGSGSFPMTPLLIARRTGAEVIGIDIDDEAIKFGRNVVEKLGSELNIRLEKIAVEELNVVNELTHIIFSSTVDNKYDILDQLHTLTNENIIVAMRYGDQLKSLFNFPMREVDNKKWKIVENILRPDHVFDIVLYKKA